MCCYIGVIALINNTWRLRQLTAALLPGQALAAFRQCNEWRTCCEVPEEDVISHSRCVSSKRLTASSECSKSSFWRQSCAQLPGASLAVSTVCKLCTSLSTRVGNVTMLIVAVLCSPKYRDIQRHSSLLSPSAKVASANAKPDWVEGLASHGLWRHACRQLSLTTTT